MAVDGLRFRTIHGYRRAFIQTGRGPVVLLIHGIGDSADAWLSVIEELARDHTVIAPDLLGHGDSDKPRADYSLAAYANAMRDLLNVLEVESATVVGHSLGGGVAMQFAYQFPELCERLVLVSTGGVSHEVNPILRLTSAPNADFILPLLGLPGSKVLGRAVFKALQLLKTNVGRDAKPLARAFESLPDAASRRAFVRTLRAVVDWRGQAITMLDRCYLTHDVPTLLVWGARDGVIPVTHAYRLHAALPDSHLEVFDDSGHFPHQDDTGRFVTLFREFHTGTRAYEHSADQWRKRLRHGAPTVTGRLAAATPSTTVTDTQS